MSSRYKVPLATQDEIPQEFTSTQIENIKNNMPTSMANVNIVPYHIYDEDEHIVGEWRQTVDGVKKKKSVYEKTIVVDNTQVGNTRYNFSTYGIQNVETVLKATAIATLPSAGIKIQLPRVYAPTPSEYGVEVNWFSNTDFGIVIGTGYTGQNAITSCTICFRYIKSTDEWEVVA